MTDNENAKILNGKRVLYSAEETPPRGVLILSSLQQMLLLLSIGMALPVSIARVARLSASASGSFLAAGLLCMGVASIMQTIPGRFLGSGYQAFSASDSAAISACVLAAEAGGIPLVLGMTVFTSILRFILGSFAFRLRKLFPAEVTGTLIFILGINLVPTAFKYFLGTGGYSPIHLAVAGATLLFMLTCALFIKPLKPYTALSGVVFGYVLSIATGVFDVQTLSELSGRSIVALPFYNDLSFAFDFKMIIPFIIISIAGIVDNIGDFSAIQNANDPNMQKPEWRSIERGIRGGALASALMAFAGGSAQSTSTANIGIAKANGITSRKVTYVAGGILIAVSFFPWLMGVLSMIPEPVLGAVLLYSMCYIMSGGFSTLMTRELDDRRIFSMFLSIGAAISTLIPGLYAFLPDELENVIASPMIMGVIVLLFTTLFGRIGTQKKYAFITGTGDADVRALNEELENVCRRWGTKRTLLRKLQVTVNALCEGLYEQKSDAGIRFSIRYDQLQIKLHIETQNVKLEQDTQDKDLTSLNIALKTLQNSFDNVNVKWNEGSVIIDADEDI